MTRSTRGGSHIDTEGVLRTGFTLVEIASALFVRIVAQRTSNRCHRGYWTVATCRTNVSTVVPQARRVWHNCGILADVASPAVLASICARIRILSLTTSNTARVQIDIVCPARAEVTRGALSLKLRPLRTVSAVSALSVDVCAVAWAVVALWASRLICRQGWAVSFGFASELLS